SIACVAEPDVLTRAALLGNVLEMDDVHRAAILHPGPVVWPAVLSAARDDSAGMDSLLIAAVRGYEAVIAVGATFDAHHYAHFHNSSTAGGFGSAAAAASIYNLDSDQLAAALGNAGSIAGGLWQMRHEPVMTKQLHVAHAALGGLWIARLARRGFTGPLSILEGPQGLYAATVHDPKPMAFGRGWRIDEVSFKPWAACRHAHPVIDAALELKSKGGLRGPIRVDTYRDAIEFCDRPQPATPAEARFSLQHAVAVVAVHGEPAPAHFEDAAIVDPAIAEVRAAVEVGEAEEFTARYPEHFGARVSAGGESISLVDTRGDPERPLAPAGVIAKAQSLFAWGGVGEDLAKQGVAVALEGEEPAELIAWLEAIL
ncbi:MAG TPA: MmgE/PrpD family protein, partial [Allosphingosinicella sp.]|nr:MmgE/PrpD family protein [Allosphingosinicella sp.]